MLKALCTGLLHVISAGRSLQTCGQLPGGQDFGSAPGDQSWS